MTSEMTKKIDQLQPRLLELATELIDNGYEMGVQVAIYHGSDLVVDIAEGKMFADSERPVQSDTLFPTCSTSKGIAATLLHILASQGKLDYDSLVSRYWPEYGCNGKETTTVRQALSHQAGIPQNPEFTSFDEIWDWDTACAKVAALTPKFAPGTSAWYHAYTFGWLAGRIAEGAGGKRFGEMFKEYITRPLGIDREMFFGTDDEAETRVSPFVAQPSQKAQNTTAAEVHANAEKIEIPGPIMHFVNMPELRRGCLPSVSCITSARAIARVYASVIDEAGGVRLIPENILNEATTCQIKPGSVAPCFGHGFGLGYGLKGTSEHPGSFFGHGGAGGSEGMVNRPLKLAIGITKNRMDTHENAPGHTNVLLIQKIKSIVGTVGDGGFYEIQ